MHPSIFGMIVAASFLIGSAAHAMPCDPGALSNYLGLGSGGCEIGSLNFSGFAMQDPPEDVLPISAAAVNVAPLTAHANSGLSFTLAAQVNAGPDELLEILIGFRVTATTRSILGNSVELLGSTDVTGSGAITVVESKCIAAEFPGSPEGCTGASLDLVVFDLGSVADRFESVTFSPVFDLEVVADLAVDGGPEGLANLSSGGGSALRFNLVNEVPEPSSASLLAIVLLTTGFSAVRETARHSRV